MTAIGTPGLNERPSDRAKSPLSPVQRMLLELHSRYASVSSGAVADYIPELSKANPDWFGISVVTLDGHEYSVGDTTIPFTIQSISKPFVYGLALEDNGEEYVLSRVGVEPSGDAFNAISLHPATGIPSNPMINAGAIATAAMVRGHHKSPLARMSEMFSRYAGHEVVVDDTVYRSERATGHRNRAIGHLLRNFEIVSGDPEGALDLYFQQCSVSVTCRSLAVMAACLANGGVNPVTGERAVRAEFVPSILSVMGSCGMYDFAGEWIYRVGMPAKSGVSGGVLAVLPGQMGIGVFSPRLDERGNSVRGVSVCADLSREYGLHVLSVPSLSRSVVRVTYDASTVRSKRQRQIEASTALAARGHRIKVYELQGDLVFASLEAFSRQVWDALDELDIACIDFKHTQRIDDGAVAVLDALIDALLDIGKIVAVSGASLPELAGVRNSHIESERFAVKPDKDVALEWCEDQVLRRAGVDSGDRDVAAADNELLAGIEAEAIQRLEELGRRVRIAAGEQLIKAGATGDSVYLLTRGSVSVSVERPSGGYVRVATISAGMACGEMALLGENVRSATVIADSDVECIELVAEALANIDKSKPGFRGAVMENLARKLAGNLRRANAEVQALSG